MPTKACSIDPLRRGMVRRVPSKPELARRRAIQITARDKDLLVAVYKLGFMTVEQIERAFFPPPATRTSASSAAYERTHQLWLWNYVERVELPVPRTLGGRQPCLLALGRRAVSVVSAELGQGSRAVHQRRLDRLDDQNIDHDLKTATFWAHLKALVDGTEGAGLDWVSERDIRAEQRGVIDPATNKRLPVLPDGEFRIVYPEGDVQLCYLEVDMASMPEKRFRRKMRAFDLFLNEDLHEEGCEQWRAEVYVLTTSRRRLENLRDWTRAAIEANSRVTYYFATFRALDTASFAGQPWQDLDGDQYRLLLDQAYDNDNTEEEEDDE